MPYFKPGHQPEEPTSLIESMRTVLRRLKMDDGASVGSIFQTWNEVVGADLAQHIQPIKLDGGVLLVEASDAAWATQFRFLEKDVRARLLERTGSAVDSIVVRQKRRG